MILLISEILMLLEELKFNIGMLSNTMVPISDTLFLFQVLLNTHQMV